MNILESDDDIIVHQVNCMGVMGAGLARSIKDRWPEVFDSYLRFLSSTDEPLGRAQFVHTDDGRIVVNMFAQHFYGRGKRYTDYEKFHAAMVEIRRSAEQYNYSVAIPYYIGCGLAGGNWKIINQIIADTFNGYENVKYYAYTPGRKRYQSKKKRN